MQTIHKDLLAFKHSTGADDYVFLLRTVSQRASTNRQFRLTFPNLVTLGVSKGTLLRFQYLAQLTASARVEIPNNSKTLLSSTFICVRAVIPKACNGLWPPRCSLRRGQSQPISFRGEKQRGRSYPFHKRVRTQFHLRDTLRELECCKGLQGQGTE